MHCFPHVLQTGQTMGQIESSGLVDAIQKMLTELFFDFLKRILLLILQISTKNWPVTFTFSGVLFTILSF